MNSAAMRDRDCALLQGALLLADKLCLPSSLSSIQKRDWSRVGRPVLEAIREISGQDELCDGHSPAAVSWKKQMVCVVWFKLLSREAEEDVEMAWRKNPFFSLQNSLPELSRVVLLELVKSTAAAGIYAGFLRSLPQPHICTELERLTEHVMSYPIREDDVRLLLEVWWELWRGGDEQRAAGEDSIETMFANQFERVSSQSPSLSPQAAKRLKLDTAASAASQPNTDVLHVLLHALQEMKEHVSSADLCFQSLSVSLSALYTSFLIDQEVVLPTTEKMHFLSTVVSTRGKQNKVTPEVIREAQRDLRAAHTPSHFQPSRMTLGEALKIVADLVQFWGNRGFLDVSGSSDGYPAFQLQQSLKRVLTALDQTAGPEAVTDGGDGEAQKKTLRGLLRSLAVPAVQSSPEVNAQVTSTIISHCLDDYQRFAVLFAREPSRAGCDEDWLDCLEKNQAAFRQQDILLHLSSTLRTKLHSSSCDVSQCRRLMKITADIFSALSLQDQNKVLAAVLRLSSRGFFGTSAPPAVTDRFEQELNMAFNCIIQGRAEASAAASQAKLHTAASLVARVAFQNPEAALRSCCHSAVFNKGAFSLMAEILQQLPGLQGPEGRGAEGPADAVSGGSLICSCLQEVMRTKPLSAGEEDQLLRFLGLLMKPVITAEGQEKRRSFLPPQEVVNTFVLLNLCAVGQRSVGAQLSLQLLHTALSVDVQEAACSPHWVLDCSPFPLLYILAQLYHQTLRCWEQPAESTAHRCSMDRKELLVSVLTTLGQVVGAEVAAAPSSWSRPLFWLYNKMEDLDWTVRFHLKPVWGQHFKNEVPSSLLTVCDLPEQEWSGLDLPLYGQGTGLLAWMECCCVSDSLQSTMLSSLSLDRHRPDHINMFSKGLLVALTQTLPWCSLSQWTRLLRALRELIASGRLHVPFSLEYVDYLPLLDLRMFSCELRLSVLLLRVLQLLCGSSCSHWLSADGWAHVSRLYALALREMISSVRAKLPLPSSAASASRHSDPSLTSIKAPKGTRSHLTEAGGHSLESPEEKVQEEAAPSQEVLFVLSQLFCHVQHIQVMMPGGQSEPLFLSSLDILSHYEAIMAAFPDSCSPLESDNTRHFFSTITDNLQSQEMKAVLQQKIAQLVSSAA